MEQIKNKKKVKCTHCGHEWLTKSDYFLVSCPKCGNKVRIKSLQK